VDIDYEDELEAAERLLVRLSAEDAPQRPVGPRCPR
jgi:hypothetical protein